MDEMTEALPDNVHRLTQQGYCELAIAVLCCHQSNGTSTQWYAKAIQHRSNT